MWLGDLLFVGAVLGIIMLGPTKVDAGRSICMNLQRNPPYRPTLVRDALGIARLPSSAVERNPGENSMKSLWASVQGDPVFMRRVNGWLTLFWIAMIPVSLVTHWVNSVVYVSALSLWALVSGHWSAWQAARVEVKQDEQAASRDTPGSAQPPPSEDQRGTEVSP